MTDRDLTALLVQARNDNERLAVTGMLLYRSATFLQVLEGDENIVNAVFEKIARDSRHNPPKVILTGHRATRQFPNWSMGFTNLSGFTEQNLPGFSEFLSEGFNTEEMSRQPQRAYQLLLRFRDAD